MDLSVDGQIGQGCSSTCANMEGMHTGRQHGEHHRLRKHVMVSFAIGDGVHVDRVDIPATKHDQRQISAFQRDRGRKPLLTASLAHS